MKMLGNELLPEFRGGLLQTWARGVMNYNPLPLTKEGDFGRFIFNPSLRDSIAPEVADSVTPGIKVVQRSEMAKHSTHWEDQAHLAQLVLSDAAASLKAI